MRIVLTSQSSGRQGDLHHRQAQALGARTKRIGREEVDTLYRAIQDTKIQNPTTDCISPIGEELLLKGLRHVVPGEFYAAATRPPAVYRGNPFVIEAALAYGGVATAQKVSYELLLQLLDESDSRTLKLFLTSTFDGMGNDGAEKILRECRFGPRQSPSKLTTAERKRLFEAMRNVNTGDNQSMQVLRYANRVPLQFKQRDCAVTQTIMGMNWRSYGLTQGRGSLPSGPVTVMVHMASVWVPFTSESKEAIASYPEIEKELRLALQTVGRKLGVYLKKRQSIKQEGERRSIFLRYLKEVAGACEELSGADAAAVYEQLVKVARRKTAAADTQLDDRGRKVDGDEASQYGGNVLIVDTDSEALEQHLLGRVSKSSNESGEGNSRRVIGNPVRPSHLRDSPRHATPASFPVPYLSTRNHFDSPARGKFKNQGRISMAKSSPPRHSDHGREETRCQAHRPGHQDTRYAQAAR
ncbi:MAG: hypothetical protein R3B96_06250 [Pirellulaceae bacterium]